MPARAKLIAAGGAAAVAVAAVTLFAIGSGRGCSSRDDVTARVSVVSSALQEAAAQGRLKVEELATNIKRLNTAATAYDTTQDHQTYCDALDALSEDLRLRE
jgi:hypothetical protein